MKNISIRRALLSVSDKTGIVEFASSLASYDTQLISTGGTAKVLQDAGLTVIDVATITGYPEMLDGRVKTLHPSVHGALLGVRDKPTHLSAMEEHSIEPIDLICIDLYPFEQTVSKDGVTDEEAIEQIDIGGPAMIRSAAKNHAFVTVITKPSQYDLVLADLDTFDGETTYELRCDLAKEAFARTASYDKAIYQWMDGPDKEFPSALHIDGKLEQTLRYGENPDHRASLYKSQSCEGPSIVTASVVSGKPLSYNNLMDAAAALELIQDIKDATGKPSAAVIKHTNPCGAAVSDSIADAFTAAWQCDKLAAFGGIVSISEPVELELAHCISHGEKFFEVIVAPSFSKESIEALSDRWKNIRLLAVGHAERVNAWQHIRSIEGGILVQELRPIEANPTNWSHVAGPNPTETQLQNAALAWITCGHLKSNSISIVDKQCLIGGGMGQVDRVSAAKLAIQRAGNRLTSASSPVAGSDAFFPFPDGPKLLIEAGITCIVQPGGSVRDQETIDLCESNNITLLHTGSRCFRH